MEDKTVHALNVASLLTFKNSLSSIGIGPGDLKVMAEHFDDYIIGIGFSLL